MKGVDDASIESGGDPAGSLLLRGPSVGVPLNMDTHEGEQEGWFESGERARVFPNGSFKVVSISK